MYLLVISLVVLVSPACLGIAVDQLYNYGADVGDRMLIASDVESSEIHIDVPFVLFGKDETSLHVS